MKSVKMFFYVDKGTYEQLSDLSVFMEIGINRVVREVIIGDIDGLERKKTTPKFLVSPGNDMAGGKFHRVMATFSGDEREKIAAIAGRAGCSMACLLRSLLQRRLDALSVDVKTLGRVVKCMQNVK